MTGYPHAPAIFVADDPGLDFLNSIATPVDEPVDWIADGGGLLDWLAQSGLAPQAELDRLKDQALPGELDAVAEQARSLREWFRGFALERKGRPLTRADLAGLGPLNRLLERDDAFGRIVEGESADAGLRFERSRRWRTPDALLLPIGDALAGLVCETDFSDVKACEGHACTLMFVDRTKARARRWCSMAVCGNRAKQAAHRSKRKAAG